LDNINLISDLADRIFAANTEESKQAVIAISRLLSKEHISDSNACIYLKILNLNLEEVSEAIFSNRTPELLFSSVTPSRELVVSCLSILIGKRPKELNSKNILACLGVLQNTYKNPKYGFNVYQLSISDIQNTGKYLIIDDSKINVMIIELFNDIYRLYYPKYKDSVIKAREIIDCYFDKTKQLSDVIPGVLLV
jgi:hypothetical protein